MDVLSSLKRIAAYLANGHPHARQDAREALAALIAELETPRLMCHVCHVDRAEEPCKAWTKVVCPWKGVTQEVSGVGDEQTS